jgi:type VI secretion system secreted protein Hcp
MAHFLDIPGIPGESSHDLNANWNQKIQIETINYDASQRASIQTGTGLTAAGASMSHISITKAMDKSTPFLFFNLCAGIPIPKMTLRRTRSSGAEGVYEDLTIDLSNVLVTSYHTSGERGGSNIPMESISLSVGAITETYDNRENGRRIGMVRGGHDFQKGMKV